MRDEGQSEEDIRNKQVFRLECGHMAHAECIKDYVQCNSLMMSFPLRCIYGEICGMEIPYHDVMRLWE
jgi:hypothetical protein